MGSNGQHGPWSRLPGRSETLLVVALALAAGAAAAIVFSSWPGLDIAVSRAFQQQDGSFAYTRDGFLRVLREVFLKGFTAWYVLITIGMAVTWSRRPQLLGFDFRKWFYLAACSIAGPLLLVNVLLKEHWGRWRPREIVELGGAGNFTPPLNLDGTCLDNCSFVSGEVASMVMAFAALAFVTTSWRPAFYALALAMGAVAAALRVGQGGHFLSDTLFAGIFMVLIAASTYWLMFLRRAP